MFRRVLVGVDGGPGGRDAIALASLLTAPDGEITLAHIYGRDLVLGRGGSETVIIERAEAEMLLEQELDSASLDAKLVASCNHRVGRGLHLLAEQLSADLIVIGSTRHGLLGRVLIGDDTRAALNGSPCAVAVASRGYRFQPHPLATVGVGYDGSPESRIALAAARELAARHGSTILALQVVSLEDVRGEAPIPADWPEDTSRLIHQSSERLRELGDDVLGDAVYGGPREELVRFGENLDLLLIGSRGYGPVGRLFHGHVSDYLVRHAPCPLVILPRGVATGGATDPASRTQVAATSGARH
jgi:nucleotide-binding universal stress UspA family protein